MDGTHTAAASNKPGQFAPALALTIANCTYANAFDYMEFDIDANELPDVNINIIVYYT